MSEIDLRACDQPPAVGKAPSSHACLCGCGKRLTGLIKYADECRRRMLLAVRGAGSVVAGLQAEPGTGRLLAMCRCRRCGREKRVLVRDTARLVARLAVPCRACSRLEDLTRRPPFGEWTVIGPHRRDRNVTRWRCRCSCGEEAWVIAANLLRGLTSRCNDCRRKNEAAAGACLP
ncbi:hypothetical protein [Limnoglobus roseus]|uniref:Uncharacterized protein n=1 Tax=Limnoglobus roseus TaxID=2598579 RepID=A0A5C1AMW9_9BACT|nr:hypothetical protein [Limnoglobus roseus]QEL19072.1 hypothetical protein PX52LOC_06129 [Limnoglobus roseus]